MTKKHLYILITYVAVQLSAFIGMPILYIAGTSIFHVDDENMKLLATGIWVVFSFTVGLVFMIYLLKNSKSNLKAEKQQLPISESILWAVGGIFLAFVAQLAAVFLERALGIEPGSENTQQIMRLINYFPLAMIVSSIIGPVLEELVFRKVIFGTLYNRFPFGVAALLSSLAFSLAHFELKHLILYAAMGFTFAFLYVRTGRIIVPIISHMAMNTLVTIGQFRFKDIDLEKLQGLIGGLFW